MMTVDKVKFVDAGMFMCVARNALGKCWTVGELNVQGIYDVIPNALIKMTYHKVIVFKIPLP